MELRNITEKQIKMQFQKAKCVHSNAAAVFVEFECDKIPNQRIQF